MAGNMEECEIIDELQKLITQTEAILLSLEINDQLAALNPSIQMNVLSIASEKVQAAKRHINDLSLLKVNSENNIQ